jgi:hypothetical protein
MKKRIARVHHLIARGLDLGQAAAAQPKNWREQRKKQAAAIRHERKARADELRRSGVRNPVAQAEEELAERYQYASGPALNRWLRRNR